MAAAGSNNCAAGAMAGVTGELTADTLYNHTNLSRQNSIEAAKLTGALSSAMIVGPDDGDSVFAGSQIGRNAGENNALYIGGRVKLPYSDKITGKGNDYDIHSGLKLGIGLEEKSIGTDGYGKALYLIPEFGFGGYINIVPHNESVDKSFSLGYRNSASFDYLTTNQNNTGVGVTVGISTSPITWIPGNITVNNPK